jgi:hypothetical protein
MRRNNEPLHGRRAAQRLAGCYPVGTRIELRSLCNYEEGMPTGLKGTVVGVDDQPALLMEWDNGRSLSILPDEDDVFVIHDEEHMSGDEQSAEDKQYIEGGNKCQTM